MGIIPNEITHEFVIDKPTALYMGLAFGGALAAALLLYAFSKKLLNV